MDKRIFTPRTARECAAVLRPVARIMCRLLREMDAARAGAGGPDEPVERSYFSRVEGFLAARDRIEASGASVADPRTGLIDFPAIRAGKPVFLCWWLGEPTVAFWRDSGEGFSARHRVDEDGPWEEPSPPCAGPE